MKDWLLRYAISVLLDEAAGKKHDPEELKALAAELRGPRFIPNEVCW